MDAQLLGLVLLIEFVLAVSLIAPLGLSGKFSNRPTLGISVWFLLFVLSTLAALTAFLIAASFIFQSYFNLQAGGNLFQILVISFAPWLLLGFGGVLLAITNLRLAPYFDSREAALDLDAISTPTTERFEGVEIRRLSLPGYFAIAKSSAIYLSQAALELEQAQKTAVLWHELGHIRLGHQFFKGLSSFAMTIAPWFLVSRVFNYELTRLCELAADNYALKRVERQVLNRARRLFL